MRNRNGFINSKTMKNINKLKILELIRTENGITRNMISSISGLDISTVSKIVNDLIKRKTIVERGIVHSKLGRHSKKLFLNRDFMKSLIVDLGVNSSMIGLGYFDTSFEIIKEFETVKDPKIFFETLKKSIENNVILSSAANTLVLIGVPGMVNQTHKKILFAPNLKWKDVDIEEFLPLYRIHVENDANLAVIAEQFYNTDKKNKPSNFIYIFLREGIGGGIITEGRLYRGSFNSAGEIGHMKISDKNDCFCGRKGCWETLASISKVVEDYEISKKERLSGSNSYEKFRNVCALYKKGDPVAKKVLKDFSKAMVDGITNLVNIFSPESIIIGGEGVFIPDEIFEFIEAGVKSSAIWINSDVDIVKSSLNQTNVVIKGAAITASRTISKQILGI